MRCACFAQVGYKAAANLFLFMAHNQLGVHWCSTHLVVGAAVAGLLVRVHGSRELRLVVRHVELCDFHQIK